MRNEEIRKIVQGLIDSNDKLNEKLDKFIKVNTGLDKKRTIAGMVGGALVYLIIKLITWIT